MTTKIEDFQKKKEEFTQLIAKEGKSALVDSFKDVFNKAPELESIVWTQYTPHFNDGEPCEFSVHEFAATFNVEVKDQEYKGQKVPGDWNSGSIYEEVTREPGYEFEEFGYGSGEKDEDPTLRVARMAIKSLNGVKNTCEEIFQAAFGDGVKVTATRNGFDVDDYDHD